MRKSTQFLQFAPAPEDPHAPLVTPIYQTATFENGPHLSGCYDYTRSGNPTRSVLESHLASLEGGKRAFAFSSGMAAIHAVVSLLGPGEEILASRDLYGGTFRYLTQVAAPQGLAVRFVDTANKGVLKTALRPETSLVIVETPGNPLLGITDLKYLAGLTTDGSCRLVVDNSLMSPYLQQPLSHGADIVVHSATKFLGGHSDLTAGVVVTAHQDLAQRLAFHQNAVGTALSPFESWLLLRGVKTLALRQERQQRSAQMTAERLSRHPAVTRVHFPGLPGHPGAAIHSRQAEGPGSVLSIETGSLERSLAVLRRVRCFFAAVSFGGVCSSISLPASMSHAGVPQAERSFPPDLIRLSIGIEHPLDLIEDLERALD